ncbi:protein of unknown function [Xenorhabdus doucetiae]|uniref:Uncharacterized protein n=1 Tax=Xenorhabdus doucetiae TaxID=351671 RepID=A0A068QQL9_9GAMM|nr:protein of unknown function [Xenorhabdus doucetiae]
MSSSTQQPERLVRMMVMMMVKLNTVHMRVLYLYFRLFYTRMYVLNNDYT